MANLIIKSSADNLVLQGSDASPAITVGATGTTTFAENATLSGTANNLGTVTAGTLGSAVVFNNAHKDVDPSADGWEMYLGNTDVNQSGLDSTVDFFQSSNLGRLGSNITESAGAVTIGTAGWYFMWFTLTVAGNQSQTVNCGLTLNGTAEANRIGHRLYLSVNQDGGEYRGKTVIVVKELAASDVVRICGSGYFYASGTERDTMSSFQGFRLGA